MSPALEAHLRLLSQLPVHTHECGAAAKQRGMKYTRSEKQSLRESLLKLQARGLTRKQMARELGTTNKTIVRLLGNARPYRRGITSGS